MNLESSTADANNSACSFDVYGYKFTISGPEGDALSGAWQDFLYFKTEFCDEADLIEIVDSEPDYDALPELEASIYTPRNIVFKSKKISYIDYQEAAAYYNVEKPDFGAD